MKSQFSIVRHFASIAVLVAIILILDFFTPGLDLFGFKFGRMATASLLIDYGKGGTRQFAGEIIKKMTVFDAFVASSKGGLKLDYAHNGHGLTLLSIDGRSGITQVMVNNRSVALDQLNQTMVVQGDLIKVDLP